MKASAKRPQCRRKDTVKKVYITNTVSLSSNFYISPTRRPLPEQQGDVRRDLHGGGASLLRPPSAPDVRL